MNKLMRLALITMCLTTLSSCGRSTNMPAQAAPAPAASSVKGATAGELDTLIDDIESFVGGAQVALPSRKASSPVQVAHRILMGFEQAPPNNLQLDDGSAIYWGRQEGQASFKSIAVYGSDGQLRLVGAVNNLPILYSWRSDRAIGNKQDYQALLNKMASWGSSPSIMLFVYNDQSLETYYPLVQRWVQAAMLGFSVDCSKPELASGCAFAEKVTLPTAAYSLKCYPANAVNQCSLPIPSVPAANINLKKFRQ